MKCTKSLNSTLATLQFQKKKSQIQFSANQIKTLFMLWESGDRLYHLIYGFLV